MGLNPVNVTDIWCTSVAVVGGLRHTPSSCTPQGVCNLTSQVLAAGVAAGSLPHIPGNAGPSCMPLPCFSDPVPTGEATDNFLGGAVLMQGV